MESAIWDSRFCIVESGGIVESTGWNLRFGILDSAELWNRWLFGVGKERGLYFLQKQKVTKTFFWVLRTIFLTRFCECRIYNGRIFGLAFVVFGESTQG